MSTALAPQSDRPEPIEDAPARPDFMHGFEGMATEPFPEAARKVLAEPPPPEAIEIKPNGIVFVPGVYYRRQLTRAFGAGGWALAPRSPARVIGTVVTYHGALYCLGRFVAEAVGECAYRANNEQMSFASCVEGAKTDALSRCCKDLGMASQLWDKGWRDQWMDDYAEKGNDGKWRARSGRPVQQIDLMAGAGGNVATPTPASTPAPSGDTGEAATADQQAEIRAEVRKLGWKTPQAREWLKAAVGQERPDGLTAVQAAHVLMLLESELSKRGQP